MRHEYGFHLKSKQEFPREDLQRADLVVRGLREGGRGSWCKGRACAEPGQGLGGQGALRFVWTFSTPFPVTVFWLPQSSPLCWALKWNREHEGLRVPTLERVEGDQWG